MLLASYCHMTNHLKNSMTWNTKHLLTIMSLQFRWEVLWSQQGTLEHLASAECWVGDCWSCLAFLICLEDNWPQAGLRWPWPEQHSPSFSSRLAKVYPHGGRVLRKNGSVWDLLSFGLGTGKPLVTSTIFLGPKWVTNPAQIKGGEIDSTSWWEELQSHTAKGKKFGVFFFLYH